jgi:hypothetical protein
LAVAAGSADALRVTLLGLLLLGTAALILAVRNRRPADGRARMVPTWGCAAAISTSRMQYTGSSYAALLLDAYGPLAGTQVVRTVDSFNSHAVDPVQDGAVLPAWRWLGRISTRLRGIQGGRLRWYLLSVIFTLLLLLLNLMNAGREP